MTTIYAFIWHINGAEIRTIDFLLFGYVDVLSIAFFGLIYHYDRKHREVKK